MGQRQIGFSESTNQNSKYLSLRVGQLAETSGQQLPGFLPVQTKNKAGEVFNFFAKTYDNLYGFVKKVYYYDNPLNDGTVLNGIKITVDCGQQTFVIDIGTKDRPYRRAISILAGVDFTQPVYFRAFLDKEKKKVLLLAQDFDDEDKPKYLRPKYDEKWLSQLIAQKVKEKLPLTEDEKRNVAYKNGKPDPDYPYIRQMSNGKWSFEKWEEFIHDVLKNEVIPACEAAQSRQQARHSDDQFVLDAEDNDRTADERDDFAFADAPADDDDDIPF